SFPTVRHDLDQSLVTSAPTGWGFRIGMACPRESRYKSTMLRAIFLLAATLSVISGCATTPRSPHPQACSSWPHYRLQAEQTTRLNSPQKDRFDASGLLITPSGEMLTMRNNHDSLLYRIEFLPGGAEARLVPWEGCFATARLKELDPSPHEFDC